MSYKKMGSIVTTLITLYSHKDSYPSASSSLASPSALAFGDVLVFDASVNLRSATPSPNRPAPVNNMHSSKELIDGKVGSVRAIMMITIVAETTQNAPVILFEESLLLAPDIISLIAPILNQTVYIITIYYSLFNLRRYLFIIIKIYNIFDNIIIMSCTA